MGCFSKRSSPAGASPGPVSAVVWCFVLVSTLHCREDQVATEHRDASDPFELDSGFLRDAQDGPDRARGDVDLPPVISSTQTGVRFDWWIESSSEVQPALVLTLSDESTLVVAGFSGRVTLGGHTVEADEAPRVHVLITRITSSGEVSYFRHLADGLSTGALVGASGEDGRVWMAGSCAASLILDPGDSSERALLGEQSGAVVFEIDPMNGQVLEARRFAEGWVEPRALAADEVGLLLGGSSTGEVTFLGGSRAVGSRGFLLSLDSRLDRTGFVSLGGDASSIIARVLLRGTLVFGLGEMSGGSELVLGVGTSNEVALSASGSRDLFWASFDRGTLDVRVARVVRTRSDEPLAASSWLVDRGPNLQLAVPRARAVSELGGEWVVEADARRQYHLEVTPEGRLVGGFDAPSPLEPWSARGTFGADQLVPATETVSLDASRTWTSTSADVSLRILSEWSRSGALLRGGDFAVLGGSMRAMGASWLRDGSVVQVGRVTGQVWVRDVRGWNRHEGGPNPRLFASRALFGIDD